MSPLLEPRDAGRKLEDKVTGASRLIQTLEANPGWEFLGLFFMETSTKAFITQRANLTGAENVGSHPPKLNEAFVISQ